VIDTFRKIVLIGIGALSLTKEKAEQLVKELAEKGHVTTDEARSFVKELLERGQRERETVRKAFREEFDEVREKWGLVTKKDLNEVLSRLTSLEESVLGKKQEAGAAGPESEETD
jgi:polyhydroxyalkanoate synthesis regulator phasin